MLRSVFLLKNTLLNNSHLERFNAVCTPFPMERHMCYIVKTLLFIKYPFLTPLLIIYRKVPHISPPPPPRVSYLALVRPRKLHVSRTRAPRVSYLALVRSA